METLFAFEAALSACTAGVAAESADASWRGVAGRFASIERKRLLAEPGIGERVIERLEQSGIHSFDALRAIGVHTAVAQICTSQGNRAWGNRAATLLRVLDDFASRHECAGVLAASGTL